MAELVTLKDGRQGWLRKDGYFSEYKPPKAYVNENKEAATHGLWSTELVDEGTQRDLALLLDVLPWLHEADAIELHNLCRAKWRHDQVDREIEGIILGTKKAHPRKGFPSTGVQAVPERLWQQVSRENRAITECCAKLGMTSTDRAALMKDTGWARALAGRNGPALGEQGRALREQRGRA